MTAKPRPIDRFRGRYRFLSNFYLIEVEFEGRLYPSSEHAFQAGKTLHPHLRALICHAESPKEAKRLGNEVKLRPMWHQVKDQVMEQVLRAKFENPKLRKKLLETHPALLIEGNTWGDTYWGCVWKDGEWSGKNTLGKLLMKLRDELREEAQ